MIKLQDKATLQKFNLRDPAIWIATWFGSGFLKPAPGTWGSVAALPFGVALFTQVGVGGLMIGAVFAFAIGLWASARFTKSCGEKDSGMIVIDEVAGLWIAMVACSGSALSFLLAFLLFRIFDILKPWPIRYLDKSVSGAFGVMIDDVLAGIFAALCLLGIHYVGLG